MSKAVQGVAVRLSVEDAQKFERRFKSAGQSGETALRKIDTAARRAAAGGTLSTRAFDSLTASARVLEGPLGGVAGRMTSVGAAFRATNPLLVAAASAFAAGTVVVKKSVTAFEEFERRQLRTNALLKVTGQASGQTAQSIEDLAQSIGRETLASVEGVRDAAAALLTFRSVSGDAFGRTLRLAQDMSAVFGTDLRASTVQLAKALEDPERNLSQLNRSGISFTQTTIDMVKEMKRAGDEAGALNIILPNIEGQLGGAGEAEGKGLAGAWDNLTESITRAFERTGEFIGIAPKLAAAFNQMAGAIDGIADNSLTALRAELADIDQRIAAVPPGRTRRERLRALAGERRRTQGALTGALVEKLQAREEKRLAEEASVAAAKKRAIEAEAARDRAEVAKAEKAANDNRLKEIKAQVAQIGKLREAERQREQALQDILVAAEREVELARLGAGEKEILLDLDKAREAAGRALTQQEEDRLVMAKRQTRAIEDAKAAEKDRLDSARREAERATGEIVDIGRDAIDSILDNRKAENFFANLVTLARRGAAQIAAEFALRPIVQPFAFAATGAGAAPGGGALGLGGVNPLNLLRGGDTLAKFAPSLFGGGAAAAAATPAAVSAAISGVGSTGALSASQILAASGPLGGATAGAGTVGASLSSAAPLAGAAPFLIPAAIGASIAIPLLSGLFKKRSSGPFSGATVELRGGRALSVSGGVDNGGEIGQGLELGRAVAELAREIALLGGGRLGRGRVGVGFGFGQFFTAADGTDARAGLREFGEDAGAAVVDAVKRLLEGGSIGGLDTLVAGAVRRSIDLGGDPDRVLADARLAQGIVNLRDGTTDLARGIRDLTREFEDAALRARELSLPVGELTGRLKEQAADLVDGFFRPLLDPLRAARAGLAAASQSPGDRFAAAEAEARRLIAAGRGGDIAAIRAAPGAVALADRLGAQTFSAASPQLAGLRAELGAGLDSIIGTLEGERGALARDFGLRFADSIDRQTATLAGEIAAMRESLGRLLETVVETQRALPRAVKKVEQAVKDADRTFQRFEGGGPQR